MSFTNRTAQAILNSLFGKTSAFGALATAPSMWVGLSTTAPAEDGTNVTEPVGNGYTRQQVLPAGWNAATLADPSVISNSADIVFPAATGDWAAGANLTHGVIFDAATGGNVIASGVLAVPKPVLSGDSAKIPAGQLTVTLD